MRHQLVRQSFTFALVLGATVFGMVLAGAADLTPTSAAAPEAPEPEATRPVAAPPVARGALPSFADLAELVSPAVVSIQATTIDNRRERRGVDPFEFFLGPRRRRPEGEERPRRSESSGSGFLIRSDGLVVTNHHVIEDADGLEVTLDGRNYRAEVKGDDPATDLALLKIDAGRDLPSLPLGDSRGLRVGDWVMVIGSPLRLTNSVSVGVVSAKGRSINITADQSLENFIQTDAAINFGNSGGPVVDLQGQVVGIATAINYGAENIGFAVPVHILEEILPQLEESGSVHRGYLGVGINDLDYESAQAFGLPSTDGALVTTVMEGGPSSAAGIRHGDVIVEADGKKVHNNRELIDYIASRRPGSKVTLKLVRDGKVLAKQVELAERDLAGAAASVQRREGGETPSAIDWLGIEYQDLSEAARSNHAIPDDVDGVWVRDVEPTSPLYDEQVAPGDVITEVNGAPVQGVADFERAVKGASSGSYLRLYVRRFDPRSGNAASFFAIVRVP